MGTGLCGTLPNSGLRPLAARATASAETGMSIVVGSLVLISSARPVMRPAPAGPPAFCHRVTFCKSVTRTVRVSGAFYASRGSTVQVVIIPFGSSCSVSRFGARRVGLAASRGRGERARPGRGEARDGARSAEKAKAGWGGERG